MKIITGNLMTKEEIYRRSPAFIQELMVSLFNILAYRERYTNRYKDILKRYKLNRNLSLQDLKKFQRNRFYQFLKYTKAKSDFYKDYPLVDIDNIDQLPILTKEDVRNNINRFFTISKKEGIVSKTGGTTGKSLEILFSKEGNNERFAALDYFRGWYGYKFGKKTAWFSGKSLLTERDIIKNRFWKSDVVFNVRYYSTFHIKEEYLKYYVEDLIKYKPEYLSGFPSTILEIAKYGLEHGYIFPEDTVKAIFPTAETVTLEMREVIEKFFHAKMYNQYSSSEGAPFIFECRNGNLHLELQSGVFEILDANNLPTDSGRLVVTSFFTQGTPLIRYDIGDSIVLDTSGRTCDCGNNNPLVKEILGRIDDYIYSMENGKINLGNISNTLKDIKGVIRFQVVQDSLDELIVFLVVEKSIFDEKMKHKLTQNWRDRVGDKMKIELKTVEDIPVEQSGKYRMVKNNIKHLI